MVPGIGGILDHLGCDFSFSDHWKRKHQNDSPSPKDKTQGDTANSFSHFNGITLSIGAKYGIETEFVDIASCIVNDVWQWFF